MRIVITGGGGFIGRALAQRLWADDHDVCICDVQPVRLGRIQSVVVDLMQPGVVDPFLDGADAVIHLAGKAIAGRWTEPFKDAVYASRIETTRNVVNAIRRMPRKPEVFVCASGVGYYGDGGDAWLNESAPPGNDFLARLCVDWETEARRAEKHHIRVVTIRTAPVLGASGGVLAPLLPLFRAGLGGKLDGGKQWSPWVHLHDIVGAYRYAVLQRGLQGAVNVSAPDVVRNEQFTKLLGAALGRPAVLRIPTWALRMRYGEFGSTLLMSQRVVPQALAQNGYIFEFPELARALSNIFNA